MRHLLLIVAFMILLLPSAGYAQDMNCEEYLEMRQADVDMLNEVFENEDSASELFIILYTLRHKYEDLTPPECAERLNQLMIASISANQDVVGLSLARFSLDDWEERGEALGERIQNLRGQILEELERFEED